LTTVCHVSPEDSLYSRTSIGASLCPFYRLT
jgi:hypothetical protein